MVEQPRDRSKRFVRGPAADLWRRTLEQIPTVFGRLVYLASLRNQNSGRYEHFGLAQAFGDDASRTLAQSHSQVLGEWLCFSLEQQKEEFSAYLETLGSPIVPVLANWLRYSPYRNFLPADARAAERELFLADLETILEILRTENGVALPDPDS